jgi:hypothetical protein
MKKTLLFVFLCSAMAFQGISQEMEEGNSFLSLGVGPATNYYSYHSGGTPAFRLSWDHGFREVGPGTMTAGFSLGAFHKYYKSVVYDGLLQPHAYRWDITYLVGAFRLGYYYSFSQLGVPNLNAYGGLSAGLRYKIFSEDYSGPEQYAPHYTGSTVDFHMALFLGANYFLTDRAAFFLEFGYDISPVTVGVTFDM